ncbi:hypothetical protein O1611_g1427 [Lasiodiplodia mahajangana]|uniref:Uncharacterized protein n=1 Tax=Lasiodiplodia mahajangana TaxID=1108764 RepID=A0ACC2JXG1_9PEZI|nr:hypothetical protein O1611_g1427 [Lasiodiplodia mahajangana]
MDSSVVFAWLSDVCSGSPTPPDIEPVVWPPSPQTRGQCLQRQRQQQSYPSAVVNPGLDQISTHSQTTKMLRRSLRKSKAPRNPANGTWQLDSVSSAINEIDRDTVLQHDVERASDQDQLVGQSDDTAAAADSPFTAPRPPVASTTATSQSMSRSSRKIGPIDSSTSLPPVDQSETGRSQSAITGSAKTRSKSPMKNSASLLKLDKRVYWEMLSREELMEKMQDRKSDKLLRSIYTALKDGFLPIELHDVLDEELDARESFFAERPSRPATKAQLRQAKLLLMSSYGLSFPPTKQKGRDGVDGVADKRLSTFLHLQSLLSELEALRTVVAATANYTKNVRTEACWNENVHKPMLDLAVLYTPGVGVENITRANIAKEFLPPTSFHHLSLPPDGKLIDYAMVLQPPRCDRVDPNGSNKLTLERIADFVGRLEYESFSQTPYKPLVEMPSGIFIETKIAGGQKSDEAQTQLGVWLASWYGRVSKFPCVPAQTNNTILAAPVLPILIIEGGYWYLYFAFDRGSMYEVCGRVSIGSTNELSDAYRLLAVLRILAHWMATEFTTWVEDCLQKAGVE